MEANEAKKKVAEAVDKLNEAIGLAADNKIGVTLFPADVTMMEDAVRRNVYYVGFSDEADRQETE